RILPPHQQGRGAPPAGCRHHRRLRALRGIPVSKPVDPPLRRSPAGRATAVSTEISNESGYPVPESEFAALGAFVLEELHVHPQAELEVRFVDENAMAELNEQWM